MQVVRFVMLQDPLCWYRALVGTDEAQRSRAVGAFPTGFRHAHTVRAIGFGPDSFYFWSPWLIDKSTYSTCMFAQVDGLAGGAKYRETQEAEIMSFAETYIYPNIRRTDSALGRVYTRLRSKTRKCWRYCSFSSRAPKQLGILTC